jgi:hypothetical protein
MALSDIFAEGGAVVGGATALGAGAGWALALVIRETYNPDINVAWWVQTGGGIGAFLDFGTLFFEGVGLGP